MPSFLPSTGHTVFICYYFTSVMTSKDDIKIKKDCYYTEMEVRDGREGICHTLCVSPPSFPPSLPPSLQGGEIPQDPVRVSVFSLDQVITGHYLVLSDQGIIEL